MQRQGDKNSQNCTGECAWVGQQREQDVPHDVFVSLNNLFKGARADESDGMDAPFLSGIIGARVEKGVIDHCIERGVRDEDYDNWH